MADISGAPVAVVTGGAGFIGSAIVKRLEADGHRVAVLDREAEMMTGQTVCPDGGLVFR